jgi:hypothetical protein
LNEFDQFEKGLETRPPLTSDAEAHTKLKRNLAVALDVHNEIMTFRLDAPPADKRLALEAANATVKAALATDRAALKARQDNALERVFLRLLYYRKVMGKELKPQDVKQLQTAPRKELEAALGQRELETYDHMEWEENAD